MTSDSTGASSAPALVSVEWLARHLDKPTVRIADVRWYLPHLGRSGRAEYDAGHLPGAIFIDLDTQLAAPSGSGPGRHPLPRPAQFAAAMSRAGIGPETHVVAYDDSGGSIAARLWWLLRYYGHERISVLDGGIAAWRAARQPETAEQPTVTATAFDAVPRLERVVGKKAVDRLRHDPAAIVLDARASERYEGRSEPVDARPGHVPGAKSAPFTDNLAVPTPTFRSAGQLRDHYQRLGVSPDKTVVAYCGSGVTACHTLLALHIAGYPHGLLYEGSWSDWSKDPSLPAATGPSEK